jgi:hypothetical protein
MQFYSERIKCMRNILAAILPPLYLVAPAYAGELVPIKGDFSGGIINADFDSEFQGKTTLIGPTVGSYDSANVHV